MTAPLTSDEHARMQNLMACAPLARIAADERLIALGLVQQYDDTDAVEPCWERVGDDGDEPYFEDDGSVSDFRYPDATTFVPRCFV